MGHPVHRSTFFLINDHSSIFLHSQLDAPDLSRVPGLLQLCLGLVLEGADVFDGHAVPVVHPAVDLAVQPVEEDLLLRHDQRLHLRLHAPPLELKGDLKRQSCCTQLESRKCEMI